MAYLLSDLETEQDDISQIQTALDDLTNTQAQDVATLQTAIAQSSSQLNDAIAQLADSQSNDVATLQTAIAQLGDDHATDIQTLQTAIANLLPREGREWGETIPALTDRYPGQQWYSTIDDELYHWNPTLEEYVAKFSLQIGVNSNDDAITIAGATISSESIEGAMFPYKVLVRRFFARTRNNETGAFSLYLDGATLYSLSFTSDRFSDSGLINHPVDAGGLFSAQISSNSGSWQDVVGQVDLLRIYTP